MPGDMLTDEELHAAAARNRLQIANMLDCLSPEQWATASLCTGWSVRHVAAHLLQHAFVGFGRFFLMALRYRGNTDATVDHFARHLARREPAEIVAQLREHAHDRVNPPRVGPWGPFTETCVHMRDIARPLGLDNDAPASDWAAVLAYLTSENAAPALTPRPRAEGIAFIPTDIDRRYGQGEEVTGTAEALAMALTGRTAALADLSGPGLATLRTRITV